jgi:hypothetical protein
MEVSRRMHGGWFRLPCDSAYACLIRELFTYSFPADVYAFSPLTHTHRHQ